MNRELNIFGDRSVGRAALGRATGYSLKCTPLTPPKSTIRPMERFALCRQKLSDRCAASQSLERPADAITAGVKW
jgi:hypothetical protein